jgi:uncharacterized membrane protein YfcA
MDGALWLPFAFLAVALVYAMVGFGGGSSYLAVLALTSMPYQSIPQIALLCNVIVTIGGVWHFHRGGHFDFKKIAPFFVLSIPMAYVGGRIAIGQQLFTLLLGISLIAAGARAFFPNGRRDQEASVATARVWGVGLPIGAGLGFLAGLVGIGGGVFLAPVLLLTGWFGAKQVAAAASLFILVNSVAGLTGQLVKGAHIGWSIIPLALAVFVGGQVGSRLGAYRLPGRGIQRMLAALILAVGLRLIWRLF